MKVKAKHWVTYNGVWHKAGEEFEISNTDYDGMAAYVNISETPTTDDLKDEVSVPAKRKRNK